MTYSSIKSNITDSLNLIVQIDRRPGKRFISEVLEIQGYDPQTTGSASEYLSAL